MQQRYSAAVIGAGAGGKLSLAGLAAGVRVVMQTGDYVDVARAGKSCLLRLIGSSGTIGFWAWESADRLVNAEHPHGTLVEVSPYSASNHQLHLEALAAQIDDAAPRYEIALSSLMALELCEAAYLSHRHRCSVGFPLAEWTPPATTDWHPGAPYDGSGGGRDGRALP